MLAALKLVELIDQFEARFIAEIVNARDVEEVGEAELGFAHPSDLADLLASHDERRLTAELRLARDFEPRLESGDCGGKSGRHAQESVAKKSFFCAMNDCSPVIFRCNVMSPSMSASGRGGQPLT